MRLEYWALKRKLAVLIDAAELAKAMLFAQSTLNPLIENP